MLVIIWLISFVQMMYEQVRLNSILQSSAERGALYYNLKDRDILTGKPQKEVYGEYFLYWRLVDFNKSEKIEDIKKSIMLYINNNKISAHKYNYNDIEVGIKDYFMYKRIYAAINVEYPLLFLPKHSIKAYAQASVNDNAEFIRNIDFAEDLLSQSEQLEEIKEKYGDGIQKLKELIKGEKQDE